MTLLEEIANYFINKLGFVAAQDIFTYNLPDEAGVADTSVCIQEPVSIDDAPSQVNAEDHYIRIISRALTNSEALQNASNCYRWLLTDDVSYDGTNFDLLDTTGIIQLGNLTIHCHLGGAPIWIKSDDNGRQYFSFTARIITKRLI